MGVGYKVVSVVDFFFFWWVFPSSVVLNERINSFALVFAWLLPPSLLDFTSSLFVVTVQSLVSGFDCTRLAGTRPRALCTVVVKSRHQPPHPANSTNRPACIKHPTPADRDVHSW